MIDVNSANTFLNSTLFSQIIFLLTGIFQTIGNQYETYSGAAALGTLFPVAAVYYGMCLSYFIPRFVTKRKQSDDFKREKSLDGKPATYPEIPRSLHIRIAWIAFVDFIANSIGNFGLIMAGSGIYQVVLSTVVAFTAIWSRIFLHKHLNKNQWYKFSNQKISCRRIAITIITVGLMFSALGSLTTNTVSSDGKIQTTFNFQVSTTAKGFLLSLFSAILFSFYYILAESTLTNKDITPNPVQLQTLIGAWCALYTTIYLFLYTIPRAQTLVFDNVITHEGNWIAILTMYLSLIISSFLHSITYFKLMGTVGAVSTGLLGSLRAVSVFVMSAIFFCSSNANQCYNEYKGVSTILVVVGILMYSNSAPSKKHNPDIEDASL